MPGECAVAALYDFRVTPGSSGGEATLTSPVLGCVGVGIVFWGLSCVQRVDECLSCQGHVGTASEGGGSPTLDGLMAGGSWQGACLGDMRVWGWGQDTGCSLLRYQRPPFCASFTFPSTKERLSSAGAVEFCAEAAAT